MGDRETVKPKWRYKDRWIQSRVGHRRGFTDAGVKVYPLSINGHEVQPELTFEKRRGEQQLVEIKYTCTRCSGEASWKSERLSKEDDSAVRALRGWIHGFFVDNECF